MGTTVKLAWRNIWRHTGRTILTMSAVGFACSVLVFFIGLQESSYETTINATTSVFHGHLQVQKQGYLEKPRIRTSFEGAEKLQAKIARIPGVKATAVRAFGFALASSEMRSYGVQVAGIQPQSEPNVSTIPGVVRKGRYLSADSAQEVVVGETLATNLKLDIGDDITLLGQGRDGSLAATVLPVVGIFASGTRDVDRGMIQLPLLTFQDTFGMGDNAHSIVVVADDLSDLHKLEKRITALIEKESPANDSLVVLRWDELLPGVKQSIDLDWASSWLFYCSLVLIVGFSILNTFLMSVLERTKEFGVMLALGTRPRQIALIILFEALALTALGLGFGLALGSGILSYFAHYGLYIPGSEEIMEVWNLPVVLHPRIGLRSLTVAPGVIVVTTLLSLLYPMYRVLVIRPVEAMRAV